MGIRIVTSASTTEPGFNPWSAAKGLLGWLLVLGGLLVAMPILGLSLVLLVEGLTPEGGFGTFVVYIVISGAAVLTGHRLIRGNRKLVLFLRRFGFAGSSRALSFAVSTAVGRQFRVVTLDDAQLAPVGTRRGMRWFLAAASLVAALGLVFIMLKVAGVFWFTWGGCH